MSSCSTPKRRKLMISWPLIVSKISANLKKDDTDYVNILKEMEEIQLFQPLSLKNKKDVLQRELGDDCSDLIDEILELLVLDHDECSSAGDKLLARNLAPSQSLSTDDMVTVLSIIFGWQNTFLIEYTREIDKLCSRDIKIQQVSKAAVEKFSEKCSELCNFFESEIIVTCVTSLHTKFGMFLSCVSKVIESGQQRLKVVMEHRIFRDRRYAVDGAVIMAIQTPIQTPVVVYELKLQVASSFTDQNKYDVIEFLVQCFYVTMNSPNAWFCLTDLEDFHYFKFRRNNEHLEIEQYFYMQTDVSDVVSTNQHMSFVKENMSC